MQVRNRKNEITGYCTAHADTDETAHYTNEHVENGPVIRTVLPVANTELKRELDVAVLRQKNIKKAQPPGKNVPNRCLCSPYNPKASAPPSHKPNMIVLVGANGFGKPYCYNAATEVGYTNRHQPLTTVLLMQIREPRQTGWWGVTRRMQPRLMAFTRATLLRRPI